MRVAHGLHSEADDELSVHLAWQRLLPAQGSFTHLTGARLRGWWLPPLPEDLPVWLGMGRNDVRPDRAGVRTIRLAANANHDVLDGLRVAAAEELLLACARDLGLLDLVVLIDAALHSGDLDLDDLRRAADQRRRGAPALRSAIPFAHPKSESAWETLLRVFHVVCQIHVEPQHELLVDDHVIARGDLWLVGTNVFHEYDGSDHLKRRQQVKDLRRARRLDEQSIVRHGYTSEDLLQRGVSILRDADRSVGRAHDPSRVRAWHALLRESLFTPAGMSRMRVLWRLAPAA